MKLSSNQQYQREDMSFIGYTTLSADDEFDLQAIARKDWTPALYDALKMESKTYAELKKKQGLSSAAFLGQQYRNKEHWRSTDFLFADIDNDQWGIRQKVPYLRTDEWRCSIDDFKINFSEVEFYILTSRNHQKEKFSNKGGVMIGPDDRYHVLFPIPTIYDYSNAKAALVQLVNAYSFLDRSVNDPTRYFYGFDKVEVFYNKGEISILDLIRENASKVDLSDLIGLQDDSTAGQTMLKNIANHKKEEKTESIKVDIIEDDSDIPDYIKSIDKSLYSEFGENELSRVFAEYTERDKKDSIMKALRIAAGSGVFQDYGDWIKLGAAMKAEGYQPYEWRDLLQIGKPDDSSTLKNFEYKWNSFNNLSDVTGGTLLWFARQADETCLKKGVSKQDKQRVIERIYKKIAVEENPLDIGTVFTNLIDEPPPERVKEISNILIGSYSTIGKNSTLIKDSFTIDAISKLDPDFSRFCYFDEAIGYPKFSKKYGNIDEVETSIKTRCMKYGIDPGKPLRSDFLQMHLMTHKFNSMQQLCNKLREENKQGECNQLLDRFSSYIRYKQIDKDGIETDKDILEYYRSAWDIFFTKMAMRMLSSYREDKVPNDYAIALTGNERIGKSFFCQWIGLNSPELFFDYSVKGETPLGSPDSIRFIRGKLIVELGEGSFMKRTDDQQFKGFMSHTVDTFVDKFMKGPTTSPRTASFIITGNIHNLLRGLHGNRRIVPMQIHSFDFSYSDDKKTMPELLAAYLEKAQLIMDSGKSGTIVEGPSLREFFDSRRNSSVDIGIHEDFIRSYIHDIECEQIETILKEKNSMGRPKTNIVFNNMDIVSRMTEDKIQVTNDIRSKIEFLASVLGYSKGPIKISGAVSKGYRICMYTNEIERDTINPILLARHGENDSSLSTLVSEY